MMRTTSISLALCLLACRGSSNPAATEQAGGERGAHTQATPPPPSLLPPPPSPATPACAAIAAAESQRLATHGGHVWNNIAIYDVARGALVASVGTKDGVLGGADARYRPGSVVKVFTVAAALAVGDLQETAMFPGKGGAWRVDREVTLRDGEAHAPMNVEDVLATSSNVGAGQIALTLDPAKVQPFWSALGFDPNLPTLSTLSKGAFAAYAAGTDRAVLVDAPGMAQSFAKLVAPQTAVLSSPKAALLRKWLRAPIAGKGATGAQAAVPGAIIIGKTGTARGEAPGHSIAHFVGAFPGDAPRYVVVVAVETNAGGYTGGSIAAPAFARIATQLLNLPADNP